MFFLLSDPSLVKITELSGGNIGVLDFFNFNCSVVKDISNFSFVLIIDDSLNSSKSHRVSNVSTHWNYSFSFGPILPSDNGTTFMCNVTTDAEDSSSGTLTLDFESEFTFTNQYVICVFWLLIITCTCIYMCFTFNPSKYGWWFVVIIKTHTHVACGRVKVVSLLVCACVFLSAQSHFFNWHFLPIMDVFWLPNLSDRCQPRSTVILCWY